MARILVTGASGFIGSALANKLHDLGHEIIVSGSRSERKCKHDYFLPPNCAGLSKLKTLDYCFHQAAHNDTTDTNEKYMYSTNCLWSLKLFEKLKGSGCEKIIYASSASVYGDLQAPYTEDMELSPLNVYAQSKHVLECVAQNFGDKNNITMIGLRYFNVYGSQEVHKKKRASMVYQLCQQALHNKEINLFKFGEQKRDWVSVHDVVDCNIKCLDYKKNGIFNVGSGIATSMNEIINILKKLLNKSIKVNYIENPYSSIYQNFTLANIKKAKEELKYIPKIDIENGINLLLQNK